MVLPDPVSPILNRNGHAGQPATLEQLEMAEMTRRGGHWRTASDQRRAQAEAQRQLDLTGAPVAPGGTFHRDMATGQVTIRYPQKRTCAGAHPAEPGHNFCTVCGGPVGTPDEQTRWADYGLDHDEREMVLQPEDYYSMLPEQDRSLAEVRRREEGVI